MFDHRSNSPSVNHRIQFVQDGSLLLLHSFWWLFFFYNLRSRIRLIFRYFFVWSSMVNRLFTCLMLIWFCTHPWRFIVLWSTYFLHRVVLGERRIATSYLRLLSKECLLIDISWWLWVRLFQFLRFSSFLFFACVSCSFFLDHKRRNLCSQCRWLKGFILECCSCRLALALFMLLHHILELYLLWILMLMRLSWWSIVLPFK